MYILLSYVNPPTLPDPHPQFEDDLLVVSYVASTGHIAI